MLLYCVIIATVICCIKIFWFAKIQTYTYRAIISARFLNSYQLLLRNCISKQEEIETTKLYEQSKAFIVPYGVFIVPINLFKNIMYVVLFFKIGSWIPLILLSMEIVVNLCEKSTTDKLDYKEVLEHLFKTSNIWKKITFYALELMYFALTAALML